MWQIQQRRGKNKSPVNSLVHYVTGKGVGKPNMALSVHKNVNNTDNVCGNAKKSVSIRYKNTNIGVVKKNENLFILKNRFKFLKDENDSTSHDTANVSTQCNYVKKPLS